MGFRSVLAAQHQQPEWPLWFVEKHPRCIDRGRLGTRQEVAVYANDVPVLPADIQRALTEGGWTRWPFVLVFLHECGGVTRVRIYQDRVLVETPEDGWVWSTDVDPLLAGHDDGCGPNC